ncbi:MAG: MBL fold metallo-hydrolase [Bacillota bacterium]
MQLTVLGCFGPYPPAGGCCSGYLLQEDNCNLLIDCGNGVLSRLQQHLDYKKLNAVILSHLHADHCSDIMIMRYGLEISYQQGERFEPLPLYAPAQPETEFNRLSYKNAYSVRALEPGQPLQIGPFTILPREGIHAIPSLAFKIRTSSAIFVYSGDTEFDSGLVQFACGADLFLCEANFLEADIEKGLPNHLSSSQAAQIAAAAGVKKLYLTHHHPERDLERYLAEAQKNFPEVEAAREGETYQIS